MKTKNQTLYFYFMRCEDCNGIFISFFAHCLNCQGNKVFLMTQEELESYREKVLSQCPPEIRKLYDHK